MGDKSEAACRQTLLVLAQNPHILPQSFDRREAERDLIALDQTRRFSVRIRQLAAKLDDTEMALGSDILSAALDGYTFAKASGKGVALTRCANRWPAATATGARQAKQSVLDTRAALGHPGALASKPCLRGFETRRRLSQA